MPLLPVVPPPRPPAVTQGTSCASVVVLRTMTRFWQPHHSFPATATILVMGLPGEPSDSDLEFWGSQKRPEKRGRVGWVVKEFPPKKSYSIWTMGCDN